MRLFLCFLLFCFSTFIFAQEYATESTVSAKVLSAYDDAFRAASVNKFSDAEKNLLRALEKEPTFLDARMLLGNVYYQQGKYTEAESEYESILKTAPSYNYQTYYNLAIAEKKAKKYDEAAAHLKDFLNTDPSERIKLKAKGHLKSAEFLAYAIANPVPFKPENLGPAVNTANQEYLPAFTADGETLIFTRNARGEDFYACKKDSEGNWMTATPITSINTDENEGAQTVTADGKLLVFAACNRKGNIGRCDLYFSTLENGVYTPPKLLPEGINTRHWESQPSLTPNGDALYFASERPGGVGRSDLFVSYRINGEWTKPRNLGRTINTPEDDLTPFIHADGQTLYFTSEGHPGIGAKDLYYSRWEVEKKGWGEPKNMGIPINTEKDEGTLVISLDGKTAYFASDRDDFEEAQGGVDLYKFELYEEAQPKKATYVKALVTDANTGKPLATEVEITDLTRNLPYLTAKTDDDGTFLIVMGVGKNYSLSVNKDGYLFYSDNFALENVSDDKAPFLLEISLTPVPETTSSLPQINQPIVLKNIFFESGSADLLPTSLTELNRLKKLLEDNVQLNIQINGHTDDVGSESDNLTLSTARAKSVYDWLIEQNILPTRLKYKGFGESQAITSNENADDRRTNRRTEFVIWK
ncbi:MAG: outer membrane protein OmpA-like peptidoglycan-associated protein [Saprospiraceae bacterium]|jgi:outer membrane protein OmpA-like peptidoglycan-associated protein/tetratricopeptide (TPR) repeat protein